jgi:hypothetical protein
VQAIAGGFSICPSSDDEQVEKYFLDCQTALAG